MAIAVAEVAVGPRRTTEGIRMGEELEVVRRERGLTQQELADRLGMTLQGYLNYRRGYGRVNRNTLPKWARALDMPIPELAERLGEVGTITRDVLVVTEDLHGADLAAVVYGPNRWGRSLVRLNPAVMTGSDWCKVLSWARRELASRKRLARLLASDLDRLA